MVKANLRWKRPVDKMSYLLISGSVASLVSYVLSLRRLFARLLGRDAVLYGGGKIAQKFTFCSPNV